MGKITGGMIRMAKYKYFKTYTTKMSHSQKVSLYNEYKSEFAKDDPALLGFDDFFNQNNFFEIVSMKCLHCDNELNVGFMNYHYAVVENIVPFPFDKCPKCENVQFVPKDVYNKLNSK